MVASLTQSILIDDLAQQATGDNLGENEVVALLQYRPIHASFNSQ